jgi:hypothetical protein
MTGLVLPTQAAGNSYAPVLDTLAFGGCPTTLPRHALSLPVLTRRTRRASIELDAGTTYQITFHSTDVGTGSPRFQLASSRTSRPAMTTPSSSHPRSLNAASKLRLRASAAGPRRHAWGYRGAIGRPPIGTLSSRRLDRPGGAKQWCHSASDRRRPASTPAVRSRTSTNHAPATASPVR